MQASGIYTIRHNESGNLYVGSAKSIKLRWQHHKKMLRANRHHSTYLQNAWNKHGEESFTFEVLLVCKVEDLLIYEQRAIDSFKPAYNVRKIAHNQTGFEHTEETKVKMSLSQKSSEAAKQHRENLAKERKGKTGNRHNEETRRKMSESHKGLNAGANARWGKKRAEEDEILRSFGYEH
jgi:group I intron endonuclease